jgi:hypothetical protein
VQDRAVRVAHEIWYIVNSSPPIMVTPSSVK